MSNKLVKETKKKGVRKNNFILPVLAAIVVVVAVSVFLGTGLLDSHSESASVQDDTGSAAADVKKSNDEQNSDSKVAEAEIEDGNLKIDEAKLSEQVTFVPYNSNGTDMEIMLVKTADGVIRGALNTCQICNGSPYAYFEQSGNVVVCQNCLNQFMLTDVGEAHGGCNPIPINFKQQDGFVVIATSDLDGNASKFINWKQGI